MVRTSASVSRTRGETVSSPSPGSSMTIVPMRAKHSIKASANVGRKETSIFISSLTCRTAPKEAARANAHPPLMMRAAVRAMWP